MHHRTILDGTTTIEHIVLKPPRARLIRSHGEGFGSHMERVINVAYETHQSFSNLMETLNDVISYLHEELDRVYPSQQFSIVVGKEFDFDLDAIDSTTFAWIEHGGLKFFIFHSLGTSFHRTITMDEDEKALSW